MERLNCIIIKFIEFIKHWYMGYAESSEYTKKSNREFFETIFND